MGVKTAQVTIDGEVYEFTTLPFTESRQLLSRLMQVVLPAIGSAFDSGQSTSSNAQGLLAMDVNLGKGVGALADKLSDAELKQVHDVLAKYCTVQQGEGAPYVNKVQETHFAGRMGHWMKWIKEGLQHNYADFLGESPLGELVKLAEKHGFAAPAAEESKQSSPTGQSG
jgi:hypothetical protein